MSSNLIPLIFFFIFAVITDLTQSRSSIPGDYRLFPGVGYYKFHQTAVTFDEAHNTCKNEGAHLAIINSEREANVLKTLVSGNIVYLGFHDRFREGHFTTIFGEPITYRRWNVNEPNNLGNEDCGTMYAYPTLEGFLNDVKCDSFHYFLCEIDLKTDVHVMSYLPNGYQIIPGIGTYKFHPEAYTFDQACTTCYEEGGYLATINSEREAKALQRISYGRDVFIGFHDRLREGRYTKIDGAPMKYKKWRDNEPNNLGNEDCGVMYLQERLNGYLNDVKCDSNHRFICKYEPQRFQYVESHVPNGYEKLQGVGYYKFYKMLATFDEAAATCFNEGAYLAIINSQSEANALKSLVSGNIVYLGFHDRQHEGYFTTIFGEPLDYTKWKNHEPNNLNNEDCGTMYAYEQLDGMLNDVKCDSLHFFVCEYSILWDK